MIDAGLRKDSPPKRQERGRQRMESLLCAAEDVFAEVGFARATTNLIAARASVSPGTLYQFYPNKEALAESLADRYAERLQALQNKAFDHGAISRPLTEFIDATVDPFLEFHRKAPAFRALFLEAAISSEPANRLRVLHDSATSRVAELFARRKPKVAREDLQWAAQCSVCIFRGMLPTVNASRGARAARAVRELKTILARYLEPLLGA